MKYKSEQTGESSENISVTKTFENDAIIKIIFCLNVFSAEKWRHDIQHNDTQHMTFSIKILSRKGLFVTLSINDIQHK